MEAALKIIVAKSPDAARLAMETMRAIQSKSPIFQVRYNRTVEIAFADQQANFTPRERKLIASYVELADSGETRDQTLTRVRLTQSERMRLDGLVEQSGLNESEFVRRKIFDEPLD